MLAPGPASTSVKRSLVFRMKRSVPGSSLRRALAARRSGRSKAQATASTVPSWTWEAGSEGGALHPALLAVGGADPGPVVPPLDERDALPAVQEAMRCDWALTSTFTLACSVGSRRRVASTVT